MADLQWQLENAGLPTFITEADRKSPCQNGYKGFAGGNLGKLTNAMEMRNSLIQFIKAEQVANYVIVWLLTNEYADEDTVCVTPIPGTDGRYNHNYEINWHEAYSERGEEQLWFRLWWMDAE